MSAPRRTLLVTAGPTREPIDPVRFISNRSSGKMGYAIAQAGIDAGYETTLITGPVVLSKPSPAQVISITTSDELFDAVAREIGRADLFVMCAAVADYKPREISAQKKKKQAGPWMLELEPTRDVLATVPRGDRVKVVMGFAAETQDLEKHALDKLKRKRCDLLVANDVSGTESGMESDYNRATVYLRDGTKIEIPRMKKCEMARELIKIAGSMQENY